jgi:hypothetical protein
MKNHGFISIAAGCLAALVLSLAGCSNPLDTPSDGTDSTKGSVTIALAQAGARTLLPQEPNFSYILSFQPQSAQAAPEPISGITKAQLEAGYSVTLTEGNWRAHLDGMVSIDLGNGPEEVKAASGESETFSIRAGQSSSVYISFNLEGISTGDGIFEWTLGDLSASADTAELKIRTLTGAAVDGADDVNLMTLTNRSGTKVLPAGYYLVQVTVSGAGQSKTWTEVVHIYTGLTTKAEMQGEFVVINESTLKERLDALGDGETLILDQNHDFLEPYTISGRTVILKSSGPERVIQLAAGGSLFTLEAGGKLILDQGVTLKGGSGNTASLVQVNSGAELTMKAGAKITGNTASYSSYSSYSYGGGVYVADSGTFTMEGGEISGNTASASGSYSYGGGVYVADSGTFTMEGGEISGNFASGSGSYSYGGGVYASGGTFTKIGGTIYGYTEDDPLSNTVKQGDAVQTGRGHAVYANATHFRDTTVTALQDMSKSANVYTGVWTD